MKYIGVEKLIKDLSDLSEHYTDKGKEYHPHIDFVKDTVNQQPMADVRENVRGEWIDAVVGTSTGYTYHEKRCSICGYGEVLPHNFCPNCGADMRGGKHD